MKYAILAVLIVLTACSKQQYTSPSAYTTTGVASCTSLSGTNTYRGDFNIGSYSGYLQLAIISSNYYNTGTTASTISNFSSTGLLTLNGSQYCCTTTGNTGSLTSDPNAIAIGGGAYTSAITSLALRCSSIGSTGAGYGGYYTNIIQVTIPIPTVQFPYVYLTASKRLEGVIKINTNYASPLPSYGYGYTNPNELTIFIN